MREKTLKEKEVFDKTEEGETGFYYSKDAEEHTKRAKKRLKEELEDTHGSSWIVQEALIDKIWKEEFGRFE